MVMFGKLCLIHNGSIKAHGRLSRDVTNGAPVGKVLSETGTVYAGNKWRCTHTTLCQ
jgi:hypothetical protein